MKTSIKVTADHIARGLHDNCYSCPIALAVIDAGGSGVMVELQRVSTVHSRFDLPPEAQEWVSRFDDHKPVQPFSFEADL